MQTKLIYKQFYWTVEVFKSPANYACETKVGMSMIDGCGGFLIELHQNHDT